MQANARPVDEATEAQVDGLLVQLHQGHNAGQDVTAGLANICRSLVEAQAEQAAEISELKSQIETLKATEP